MAKKTVQTKPKSKKGDRDVFSLHNGVKKKKSNKTEEKSKKKYYDIDEEQLTEIRKITNQTLIAKKKLLSSKNIKRQGRVNYETLVCGTVVGCRVTQVYTDRIIVSLPYRMRGYIPLTHISHSYTKLMHQVARGESTTETALTLPQLYTPGQWLLAAVANSPANDKPKTGLLLSLYPSDVNGSSVPLKAVRPGVLLQCAVTSVEDHGYTLDTGVRGVAATFLPTKECPQDLSVGCAVSCVVSLVGGSNEAANLTVTADTDKVAAASGRAAELASGLLLPGATVQGVVTVSATESLTLHLGSEEEYYDLLENESTEFQWNVGMVHRIHLRSAFDQCHFFRTGQKLMAKVLFTTNFPRTVYLTLNKTALNFSCSIPYELSQEVEMNSVTDASVFSCSDEGVTVKLNGNCSGFCFSNKAAGKGVTATVTNLREKFPPGKRVACKPVAYNSVDNMYIVVFNVSENSAVDQAAEALSVGEITPVTILEYNEAGAKVRTKKGVDGFVRKVHLTDSNMTEPEKKYPVGTTVKSRVIKIEENKQANIRQKFSVYFTFKTKFVKSQLPLISDFTEDAINQESYGIVQAVFDKVIFVEFCNDVRAILQAKDFPTRTILTDSYELGQVIQVKITELGKTLDGEKPLYKAVIPVGKPSSKSSLEKHDKKHWLFQLKNSLGIDKVKSKVSKPANKLLKSRKGKGKSIKRLKAASSSSDKAQGKKKN